MKTLASIFILAITTLVSIALLLGLESCERKNLSTQPTKYSLATHSRITSNPVEQFLEAKYNHDQEAMFASFAPNAHIQDDVSRHEGKAAIQNWVFHHISIGGVVRVVEYYSIEDRHTYLLEWVPKEFGAWRAYYTFQVSKGKISRLQVSSEANVPWQS